MALRGITLALLISFLLLSPYTAVAQSGDWAKKSTIELKDLSEVPGMVLEPGIYVLKAEDAYSSTPRIAIQLLNKDESQILTSFVAVPDNRQRPDSDAVIVFFEGITEGPRPIQTWFYPGEMNGYEFVYPTARAKEIAKHAADHVMASDSKDAAIAAVTSNGTAVPLYDAASKSSDKATATEEAQREKPQSPGSSPSRGNKTKRVRPRQR